MPLESFNKRYVYFFICLVGVITLTFFHFMGVVKPVEGWIIKTTSPVINILASPIKKLSGSFSFLSSIQNLQKENTRLLSQVEELTSEVTRLKELERENSILREELGFKERTDYDLTPAFIVGYDPSNFSQFLIIDKGSKDGIEIRDPVVVSKGILVGKIIEVYEHTAKILLIIDSRSTIPGIVQSTRVSGIVRGEHGLGLIMDTISQDEEVKVGEKVITSGLDGEYPKGLLVGEIESVEKTPNELFQKAKLKTLTNYKKIEMVFIINDKIE